MAKFGKSLTSKDSTFAVFHPPIGPAPQVVKSSLQESIAARKAMFSYDAECLCAHMPPGSWLLTHLLTYLLAYLLTYLLNYVITYLIAYNMPPGGSSGVVAFGASRVSVSDVSESNVSASYSESTASSEV